MYFISLFLSMGISLYLLTPLCAFIAIWFNELSKAAVAKKYGCLEKVSFNPLKSVSVLGFILMTITSYGWGKAQECDLKNVSKSKKVFYYFSGSIGNIICAVAFVLIQTALFVILCLIDVSSESTFWNFLQLMLDLAIWLQISMAITQLLPIPGFAGYNILKTLFFANATGKSIRTIEANGKWIFTVIVLAGLLLTLLGLSKLNVMYYASDFLTSVCFNRIADFETWFVDLVTGGLFTESGW